MSGGVTANAERVYVNQGSNTPETRKEFETKAQQCVALRIKSNRLDKSISARENRIENNNKEIKVCTETLNQASNEKDKLEQENTALSIRQKKIEEAKQKTEEAKLRALQRKNS